jgi:hypothetical protein
MEFSTENWNSHRKGQQTRARIREELLRNPNLSISELSRLCGRCERQIKRQLSNIRLEENLEKYFEPVPIRKS